MRPYPSIVVGVVNGQGSRLACLFNLGDIAQYSRRLPPQVSRCGILFSEDKVGSHLGNPQVIFQASKKLLGYLD